MSAALSYPLVYIVITPVASGEHYRSAAVSEGSRHTLVEYLTGYMHRLIAIVIFQVVNAPLGERFCVLKFVLKAAGVTCAGMRAGTRIDTEFKSLRVYIISYRLDAVRELPMIRHKLALFISLLFAPAVVYNNIFIACVLESVFDECVSRLLYKLFVYLPGERVPAVPAHRGCHSE